MMIYRWVWVVPTEWKLPVLEPAVVVVLVELLINFSDESNQHPQHYSYYYYYC